MREHVLVATSTEVLDVNVDGTSSTVTERLEGERPTGLAADPWAEGRAWCCTSRGGVFRSGGGAWERSGLEGERLMAVVASPAQRDLVWAGAEPSAVWRSDDAGESWHRTSNLDELPSSSEWAFPPRPETHHVRWIACHPREPGRLWVAVEAGALIRTADGGHTWTERVPGGPYDTHELAVHPEAPDLLRVSAGDGYFESHDGGDTWSSPMRGLEVGYLRSVAIDPGEPEITLVSGASSPRSAYVAGRSDGRLYRREGSGRWRHVTQGWPDPPGTIAPLLVAGRRSGEFWAADERGLHRSSDSGATWQQVYGFDVPPQHLRGLVVVVNRSPYQSPPG